MSAYVIVDIEVTDPAAFGQYGEIAGPIIAKYGGRFLAVGPPVGTLEGEWQPKVITMIEFPSVEDARRWHDAPEYQEPKQLRQRASISHVILVNGLPGSSAL
jgi:uncharacterized protein (DUF1330 family)